MDRFEVNRFLFGVLQRGDANLIVMAAWMCTWRCKTHYNGCMNVAWGWFWGGSRSTKPCLFSCKVAAAGDGRYLVCVCESNPVPKGGSFFAIFVVRFFRPMIKTGGLPDL